MLRSQNAGSSSCLLRSRGTLPPRHRAIQPRFRRGGDDSALSHQRRPAPPKALSSPTLSPDGKQVLFTLTHATADGAASHLWIVPASATTADKPRQLTFSPPADKRGEHNAQWAPDSSAIFFLAKRGDHTQLFRLDLRGGEASPYDLKILPPVDVSKDKDAINPPPAPESSEKKEDKKTCRRKAGAATHRRRRLRHQRRRQVSCTMGA